MKNTNESGRSMVEMLGVLAIIGVLSVGGLMGYKQAMTKYYTNEAAQAIAINSTLCLTNHDPKTNDYLTNVQCVDKGGSGDLQNLTFANNVDQDMLEQMFTSGTGRFDKDQDTFTLS